MTKEILDAIDTIKPPRARYEVMVAGWSKRSVLFEKTDAYSNSSTGDAITDLVANAARFRFDKELLQDKVDVNDTLYGVTTSMRNFLTDSYANISGNKNPHSTKLAKWYRSIDLELLQKDPVFAGAFVSLYKYFYKVANEVGFQSGIDDLHAKTLVNVLSAFKDRFEKRDVK